MHNSVTCKDLQRPGLWIDGRTELVALRVRSCASNGLNMAGFELLFVVSLGSLFCFDNNIIIRTYSKHKLCYGPRVITVVVAVTTEICNLEMTLQASCEPGFPLSVSWSRKWLRLGGTKMLLQPESAKSLVSCPCLHLDPHRWPYWSRRVPMERS